MHIAPYLRHFGAALRDYGVAWTFGNTIGPGFWLLVLVGKIRLRGFRRFISAVWQGNVIIAANHPSLVETLLVPSMGWPMGLFLRRFFIWSIPDRALFPEWLKWAYPCAHCITVDRQEKDKKKSRIAVRQIIDTLQNGYTALVHVEGGRSWKYKARKVTLLERNGRELAELKSAAARIALFSGARILPLYIEMTPERQRLTFMKSLLSLFSSKYGGVVFHFGLPYRIEEPLDAAREDRKLQFMILMS